MNVMVPLTCALGHTTNIQLSVTNTLSDLLEKISLINNYVADRTAEYR